MKNIIINTPNRGGYTPLDELYHHGILGQKWGVRRYQNKDGSLTAEGKKHVQTYEQANEKGKKVTAEGEALFKQDKRLKKDFGDYSQVDDDEFLVLMAEEYGINTDKYWNARTDYQTFYRQNRESIETGRKIVERLTR